MGASGSVGRVGGLAAALGVGATILIGCGMASADTGSADSPSHGSSQKSVTSGTTASVPNKGQSRNGAARQEVPAIAAKHAVMQSDSQSAGEGSQPVAGRPPTLSKLIVAPAGAASGLVPSAPRQLLTQSADGKPVAPGAAAVTAGMWAFTRRDIVAAGSASPTANSSAAAVFGNSLIVSENVAWQEGLLAGTIDATSTNGLPISYTLLQHPSLGGKISFAPGSGTPSYTPGAFTYVPYMSTLTNPGQNEQFSVLVSEETPFDSFLKGLPVIGLLVDPVLKFLHQVPIVSDLLAPIIGDAQTVKFNENPYSLTDQRPVAFTYMMPSFDGTLISVNYFPAVKVATGEVASAPTVLNGPDLGLPGSIDTYSPWAPSLVNIVPGLTPLRTDASPFPDGYSGGGGFNVITWDPRGEYASGGIMQLDNPFYEGRDVSSIISWATSTANVAQAQVDTDESGDPYIGMIGGSYGGGIQPTVAGTPDKRIDAIVPSIAWNTLNESLYPNEVFKTAIGTELLLALVATGARFNAQIPPAIFTGDLFGWISETAQAVLTAAGAGMLANNIDIPTLLPQGTVDILFELDAATTTGQQIVTANPSVPVKTTWFCGGHGVCLLSVDQQHEQGLTNMNNTLMWLDQYVANNGTPADSIPTFQWYDQAGGYHSSNLNPFDSAFNNPTPLTYQGAGGNLLLVPFLGGSGPSDIPSPPLVTSQAFALASGSEARNALNLAVTPPVGTQIAGAPNLSFTYSGLGISRAVYAQLVDNATGQVVGNIVTPVPVTLDGRQHTLELPMATIAYTVNNVSDSLTLQITSSATAYASITDWGFINISNVNLDVPTVAQG